MASNANTTNPINDVPQAAHVPSLTASSAPPGDDRDATQPRSTVSLQTSANILPPIPRELDELRSRFRSAWRADGPTLNTPVFPLLGMVPVRSWGESEPFAPAIYQQLKGIEPIFRVAEQSPNFHGGAELTLMIDENTPFLVGAPARMGQQHSHAFDAPTGYQYQTRLATIPEDNTTPSSLTSPYQNAPSASNGMTAFASPVVSLYQYPSHIAPIPQSQFYPSAVGNAAPTQSMPALNLPTATQRQPQYHYSPLAPYRLAPNSAYFFHSKPIHQQTQTPPPNPWPLNIPTTADVRNGTAVIESPHWEAVPFEREGDVEDWRGGNSGADADPGVATAGNSQTSIPYEGEGDVQDWVERGSEEVRHDGEGDE
ncbi:hypothetical protein DPSP01_002287 [Paraphaeosphaeria sporulosa]